jgi:hypothetical protein
MTPQEAQQVMELGNTPEFEDVYGPIIVDVTDEQVEVWANQALTDAWMDDESIRDEEAALNLEDQAARIHVCERTGCGLHALNLIQEPPEYQ